MDALFIEMMVEAARSRKGKSPSPIRDQLVPQNVMSGLERGYNIIKNQSKLEKLPRFLKKIERVARCNHVGTSWLMNQLVM